ncbi:hypothetical protein DVT68_08465 [Dyella solisilvae]|uniref:Uncharacterized protein n=1 Tax=Dyella solisilvae TaxID=1920168 RepID=A0A370K7F4_9GAMM|nr:hypothetical protein [Dyella solisilvae]RDI98554.1 hypothetical protein DVT68_08465 [Dyella solisilvae]
MHIEVPKLRAHSFREFAVHYLMIVLSILTALGLEQWIERVHHRHAAEYAREQIDSELGGLLRDIQASIQTDETKLAPLIALDKAINDDMAKGLPDAQINQHIRQLSSGFRLSINWPAFTTQAWDVAVANQSATWIEVERLHRYTAAYAAVREAASWTTHNATVTLDAPRMFDMQTRIRLGKDVDPVEFLSVSQQMIVSSKQTIAYLQDASTPIKAALELSGE